MQSSSSLRKTLDLPALSQIGLVVKDMDQAIKYYEETIGLGPFIRSDRDVEIEFKYVEYRGREVESRWIMAFGSLGSVELELIQPVSGPTVFEEFLSRGTEGLHHLGFDVKDFDDRLERYQEMGIGVTQQGRFKTSSFAYLNTEKIGGTIFELIQRPKRRA